MNLFGSNYDSVGSSNSNLLLKTKGKVKIQYGSKLIDLIKDGKINADISLIYQQDSVGSKDGIYVSSAGTVTLVVNNTQIVLAGEGATNTFVSFLMEQETTPDQKYQALKNIGLVQETLDTSNIVQNGIVFTRDTGKLYIIKEGTVSEYTVDFPSVLNGQFTINNTSGTEGSLIIQGQGVNNSIYFDTFTIYNNNQSVATINAQSGINLNINNQSMLKVTAQGVSATFNSAAYTSNNLDSTDSSTNFASTAWVQNLLPSGCIIMYSGATTGIPTGWAICDGENNTPNLTDKFIKSDTESDVEIYSLIYIMKL